MDTILAELQKLEVQFGPPAHPEQLDALATAFQCRLPASLIALYRHHNGALHRGPLPGRLMSVEEAMLFNQEIRKRAFIRREIRLFWTDDTSDYAGIYLDGPLAGMVVLFDYEWQDLSPWFRSIQSFYDASLAAARRDLEWEDMQPDYPILHPAVDQDVSRHEQSLAHSFLARYQATSDDYERRYAAFCAIKLAPYEDSHLLMPLLEDQDMWIQAEACQLLGRRRYTPAIPVLARIARSGTHNGQISAMLALGVMGDARALEELFELRPDIVPSRKGDLATALSYYGYRTKLDNKIWYYCVPASDQWEQL